MTRATNSGGESANGEEDRLGRSRQNRPSRHRPRNRHRSPPWPGPLYLDPRGRCEGPARHRLTRASPAPWRLLLRRPRRLPRDPPRPTPCPSRTSPAALTPASSPSSLSNPKKTPPPTSNPTAGQSAAGASPPMANASDRAIPSASANISASSVTYSTPAPPQTSNLPSTATPSPKLQLAVHLHRNNFELVSSNRRLTNDTLNTNFAFKLLFNLA